jgi:NitT/TauT family transport system substrate-binding protein
LYFTTQAYLKAHPEVVRAFVKGVLAGWEFSQKEPEATAEIVQLYDKENTLETIKVSVLETNRLVKTSAGGAIGVMSLDGWEKTQDVLLSAGVMKQRLKLETLYTDEFLK